MTDGGCRLIQVIASPIAVSSSVLLLLLAAPWYSGSAICCSALGIMLMEGDSGGPFQGEEPPPNQGRESALAVRSAVGPIREEADDPGVGGEE